MNQLALAIQDDVIYPIITVSKSKKWSLRVLNYIVSGSVVFGLGFDLFVCLGYLFWY